MSEIRVASVKETPVLRPAEFRSDAFFFFHQNYNYLAGLDTKTGLCVRFGSSKNTILLTSMALLVIVGSIIAFLLPAYSIPVLVVMAALSVVIPGLFFLPTRDAFTERAVYHGKILQGQIERCEMPKSYNYEVNVVYLFTTPAGKRIRRHTMQIRPDLYASPLPHPGRPIYVLYFSDNEYYLL